MAQDKRYRFLEFDLPQDLQDRIIDSLGSVQTKENVDERGRQAWGFEVTEPIKEYTNRILQTDSFINDAVGERGLEVCRPKKVPKVVRTGYGPADFVVVEPGHIAIITAMTHEKMPLWLAAAGEDFPLRSATEISKQNLLVIFPDTQFRTTGAFYMMPRPVREV